MGCKGGRGRRKVPLVKITDNKSLVRTFNRRHRTLIHKSEQLSVLCGVRVAVSIQSPQTTTGDFIEAAFDGSSSSSSSPMMIIAEEEEEEERGKGRRKKIEKIGNRESLNVTFSKRRSGLFKLAEELSVLCGVRVALSVRSPGGRLVEKTFRGGGGGDDMDDQSQKQHHLVLETTPACDHQALSPTSSSSLEHQQPQQLDIVDSHDFIDEGGITYLSLDETIDEIMGLEEPLMEAGAPPHDDDYNAAAASSSSSGLRDIGWSSDDLAYFDQIRNAWAEGVAFADSCFSSLLDCY